MKLDFTVYCRNLEVVDYNKSRQPIVDLKDIYNPFAYKRTSQMGSKFDKNYKRYLTWKKHILNTFISEFECVPDSILQYNVKYYITTKIHFMNNVRGDSDNVYKAVLDALFEGFKGGDRYCVGAMDYFFDKTNPRVEIRITDDLITHMLNIIWLYLPTLEIYEKFNFEFQSLLALTRLTKKED